MPGAERTGLRVREALTRQYRETGLAEDGGHGARHWAPLRRLKLQLPNFAWRRRALPIHDVHHLLLGYPCTPTGEFQMAAWEFAAGRFPHAAATAFCLPLIGLGAIAAPRQTFNAFVCGRSSQTLYAQGLSSALLDAPVDALRKTALPTAHVRPGLRDVVAYGMWVAASLAWMAVLASPFVAAVVGLSWR
jgi:hypothetical protein